MNILFINPPKYTFQGFTNSYKYPDELYNIATFYKNKGNTVKVLDLSPELPFNSLVKIQDGDLFYKDNKIVNYSGIVLKCGNWENEKLEKSLLRVGLPLSSLSYELEKNKWDRIIISSLSSKTDISSCPYAYVSMGIEEIVNFLKVEFPSITIEIVGAYSELAYKYFKNRYNILNLGDEQYFTNSDIDIFDEYIPNKISVYTSLGCANRCKFCYISSLEGTKRRERSIEEVLDYFEYLTEHGIKKIRLMDSNLLANWDNHFKKILQGILNRGLKFDITSYGGVEPKNLTEDRAELMKKAGFSAIVVPLDNSDDKILKKWGGGKSTYFWRNAVRTAKKYFDNICSYIMIGYPEQTYENALNSIEMCKDEGSIPGLLPFTPIPMTGYEDNRKNPLSLYPLLWPYAWEKFTVKQLEDLLDKNSKWYKASVFHSNDKGKKISHIYKTSKAIYPEKTKELVC